MIVYTGKQFGNDFNNGDEALFQDANRPRDDDKFKIKPGMQSGKWDWRGSNKNISMMMANLMPKGCAYIIGTASGVPVHWQAPKFQKSWTAGDISNIASGFSLAGLDMNDLAEQLQFELYNDPCAVIKKGMVKYGTDNNQNILTIDDGGWVEVTQSGLYVIQAFGTFYFPDGYNSNISYQYKEWVGIMQADNSGTFRLTSNSVYRACGNGDTRLHWTIGWVTAGSKYLMCMGHSYTSKPALVCGSLNMVRLQ